MTDEALARIAAKICALSPETACAEATKSAGAMHGNMSAARSVNRRTAELVEIAELLSRMESRGGKHGE